MNDPYNAPQSDACTHTEPTNLQIVLDVPEWHADALCSGAKNPDTFFSTKSRASRAIAICQGCPAQIECLDYAVTSGQNYGVWGGRFFG